MHIWVDADACPGMIKEILFRAARRTKVSMTLVANHQIKIPPFSWVKLVCVAPGFDVADSLIVQSLQPGDLVITADIPLASLVIEKGGAALNPRGEFYSVENMKQRLAIRNLNEELRSSGMLMSGPAKIGPKDCHAFACQLDKFLAIHHRHP